MSWACPRVPVRAPLRPADREAVDGLLAAYEELVFTRLF